MAQLEALADIPTSEMTDRLNKQIIPVVNILALGKRVTDEQRDLFRLPHIEESLHLETFRAAAGYIDEQRGEKVVWYEAFPPITLQHNHGKTRITLQQPTAPYATYSSVLSPKLGTIETVEVPSDRDIVPGGKIQVELIKGRWCEITVRSTWEPYHKVVYSGVGVRNPRGTDLLERRWPGIFMADNPRGKRKTKIHKNFL